MQGQIACPFFSKAVRSPSRVIAFPLLYTHQTSCKLITKWGKLDIMTQRDH